VKFKETHPAPLLHLTLKYHQRSKVTLQIFVGDIGSIVKVVLGWHISSN